MISSLLEVQTDMEVEGPGEPLWQRQDPEPPLPASAENPDFGMVEAIV